MGAEDADHCHIRVIRDYLRLDGLLDSLQARNSGFQILSIDTEGKVGETIQVGSLHQKLDIDILIPQRTQYESRDIGAIRTRHHLYHGSSVTLHYSADLDPFHRRRPPTLFPFPFILDFLMLIEDYTPSYKLDLPLQIEGVLDIPLQSSLEEGSID